MKMKKMKRFAREREGVEETLLEKWTTACRARRASPLSSRTIGVIALIGNPMKKCFFLIWIALLAACSGKGDFDLDKVMQRRPDDSRLIFDYVGLMTEVQESTTRYLENIRDRYHIEMLIVALPGLEQRYTVNQAAAELFSNWKIGRSYQSRGILLLLVDDAKAVKLEVGFELEDVFTDMFTGHAEDMQLQPHYRAGDLEIGLVALMEELEARAQVKFNGRYTRADIADLDARYFSQGAGARSELEHYPQRVEFSGSVNRDYPAGQTPRQAWQTMIRRWQDKTRDPFLGVFTPLTRLAYRDFTNMPDARYQEEFRTYADKSYTILEDGDYAVVYFGKKKGWDNAPFLLCRTQEGWQFDIVYQRRFVRMGQAPDWGVEFSEHPYMGLLMESFQFRGQDIPLAGDDLYTVERDTLLANEILDYEERYASNPGDFETALALGRRYTLVSMSRKGIKVLKKAQAIHPEDPRPYKYLAIGHVNAHYQYAAALEALKDYVERKPDDPFAYNFMGYIYYRKNQYAKAADAFEKAIALNPDDCCYADFYLAYTYAWLYDRAPRLDPRRKIYKNRFHRHVARTRSCAAHHPLRVAKLNQWLAKK
jgi:tetratricopeptide (TPR) repeat protein